MNTVQAIIKEIFIDNAYRGAEVFAPGERWIDVGCHHGWFSLYAQMHGAKIVGAVDGDPVAISTYSQRHPDTFQVLAIIESAMDLGAAVDLGDLADGIKIDIQGAEVKIFLSDEWFDAIGSATKILMEWHNKNSIADLIQELDDHRFKVRWLDEAVDTMTGEPTYILFASRDES